ncbi:MAG: DUF6433 family protein [Desulfuromonadaceae bacterium]
MTPYITETLKAISDSPDLLLTKHKENFAVNTILQYAFDVNLKFALPEGEPPFKPDSAPLGMSPANFYQQVKKFYIFTRKDLSDVRREQLFIQLLEGLHPDEAKVCIAIKDQNLTALYPGITATVVEAAGLVRKESLFRAEEVAPVVEAKPPKTKGKELVVSLSDTAVTKESFGAPKDEPVEAPKKRGRPKKVNEA